MEKAFAVVDGNNKVMTGTTTEFDATQLEIYLTREDAEKALEFWQENLGGILGAATSEITERFEIKEVEIRLLEVSEGGT